MESLNDVMFWRETLTVFCFCLFLSICLWAYSKNRKKEFEDISELVILDNDTDWSLSESGEATAPRTIRPTLKGSRGKGETQ